MRGYVQFGVVMTARIAATDKHSVSTVASHVGQRHGLVVEQKVRDRPGHSLFERERGGSANGVALRGGGHGIGLMVLPMFGPKNAFSRSISATMMSPARAKSMLEYMLPFGHLSPRSKSIVNRKRGHKVVTYDTGSPSRCEPAKFEQTMPQSDPVSSKTGPPLIPPSNRALTW
jgi:hypothetical protein